MRNLESAFLQIWTFVYPSGQKNDRTEDWQSSTGLDIAGVSLCLSLWPTINRCHLTVQSARGPTGSAGWLPAPAITEHGRSRSHQRSMTKAGQKVEEKWREVQLGKMWGEEGWDGNVRMKGEERYGRIIIVILLKVSSWIWSGWQRACQLSRRRDYRPMPQKRKHGMYKETTPPVEARLRMQLGHLDQQPPNPRPVGTRLQKKKSFNVLFITWIWRKFYFWKTPGFFPSHLTQSWCMSICSVLCQKYNRYFLKAAAPTAKMKTP